MPQVWLSVESVADDARTVLRAVYRRGLAVSLDVQQNSLGYDEACDVCGLEEPTWRVVIDALVDYYCETCLCYVLERNDP